jgi:hypothetical protein
MLASPMISYQLATGNWLAIIVGSGDNILEEVGNLKRD